MRAESIRSDEDGGCTGRAIGQTGEALIVALSYGFHFATETGRICGELFKKQSLQHAAMKGSRLESILSSQAGTCPSSECLQTSSPEVVTTSRPSRLGRSFGEAEWANTCMGFAAIQIPASTAILADLSMVFMQQDAELFGRIFEGSSRSRQKTGALVDDLVEALLTVHRDDAQVRGVVYQNLERLKLLGAAQSATRKIQARETASVSELDSILTWVAISAINAAVHSTSQLTRELQQWDFVRVLVRSILDHLLNPQVAVGRAKP